MRDLISAVCRSAADKPAAGPEQALKFAVHSIGWAPLAESDLKDPETSRKSINRCIVELTAGRTNEGLGHWAEVRQLRPITHNNVKFGS